MPPFQWRRKLVGTTESGAPTSSALSAEQGAMASKQTKAVTADGLLEITLGSLEDSKAVDIIPISLAGKSPIADHMVICSGTSSRHVATIAEKVIQQLKQEGGVIPRPEGLEQGDWALIDGGDVIIHVFRPEVRTFYNLERMWLGEEADTSASLNS